MLAKSDEWYVWGANETGVIAESAGRLPPPHAATAAGPLLDMVDGALAVQASAQVEHPLPARAAAPPDLRSRSVRPACTCICPQALVLQGSSYFAGLRCVGVGCMRQLLPRLSSSVGSVAPALLTVYQLRAAPHGCAVRQGALLVRNNQRHFPLTCSLRRLRATSSRSTRYFPHACALCLSVTERAAQAERARNWPSRTNVERKASETTY